MCDKEVTILVDAACTTRTNGVPEVCSCCANAANCENGFPACRVSTSSSLEDNESMMHKYEKVNTHNNKQVKRERTVIL